MSLHDLVYGDQSESQKDRLIRDDSLGGNAFEEEDDDEADDNDVDAASAKKTGAKNKKSADNIE